MSLFSPICFNLLHTKRRRQLDARGLLPVACRRLAAACRRLPVARRIDAEDAVVGGRLYPDASVSINVRAGLAGNSEEGNGEGMEGKVEGRDLPGGGDGQVSTPEGGEGVS